MSRRLRAAWLVLLLALPACHHAPAVQVPPRVDLSAWPVIGIVEFAGDARAEYAQLATRRFVEMLHAAQPGARILELGSPSRVLSEIGHDALDFEAVRALGKRYEIDAVFTGELALGEPKPHLAVGQFLDSLDAGASVHGELTARLYETKSGASLWSRVSDASTEIAGLRLAEGMPPSVGAVDPSEAYTAMVRSLVAGQSGDFYPTWVRP